MVIGFIVTAGLIGPQLSTITTIQHQTTEGIIQDRGGHPTVGSYIYLPSQLDSPERQL